MSPRRAAAGVTLQARSQDTKKIPRVGILSLETGDILVPLREGLRALGYIDGKTIRLEERVAGDHYDRFADIAGGL